MLATTHNMAFVNTIQLQTSLVERTNRSANDFDSPQAPRVVQFLFCLIVDLRMVHTRPNSTLALDVEIFRNSLRVLHNKKTDINCVIF